VPAYDDLVDDLWFVYYAAGRDVTYVTEQGDRRPYWGKHYMLALECAIDAQDVVTFVEGLVAAAEPARGFEYLRDARRLDLAVEALVADPAKSYHGLFSAEVVRIARERLEAAGYRPPIAAPTGTGEHATADAETIIVRVHRDGAIAFCLRDRVITVNGTSEALRMFESALDDALGGPSSRALAATRQPDKP
jgi:hypothetical protein